MSKRHSFFKRLRRRVEEAIASSYAYSSPFFRDNADRYPSRKRKSITGKVR